MKPKTGCLLSALLLMLCLPFAYKSNNLIPPVISSLVIWIAWVPIALGLRLSTPRESLKWGFLTGLLGFGGVLFWIIIAISKYGGLNLPTSVSILFLLLLLQASYPAITFWATARFRPMAPPWIIGPLVFSILEWTKDYFPLEGFPWTNPGFSLYGANVLIQITDIGGVFVLCFIVTYFNFLLAESLHRRNLKQAHSLVGWTFMLILLGCSVLYGVICINHFNKLQPVIKPIRIGIVQGNIPQDIKWQVGQRAQIVETYSQWSKRLMLLQPDLVVWPEAAIPVAVHKDIHRLPFTLNFQNLADLLLGLPSYSYQHAKREHRNSAFVLSPQGDIRSRYDKQHLVPFGEYVPLSSVLPMHRIVPPAAGNFVKGDKPQLVYVNNVPYGILICYELIFSNLANAWVNQGARFLVNISNDAWFERTSGPFQHVAHAAFRAIETRRTIVRATNTGVSGWADVTGIIHQSTNLFTETGMAIDIIPRTQKTFYVRHPHLFPWIAILSLMTIWGNHLLWKRRNETI